MGAYQAERKPHARAMIRLAKLIGTVMTGGGELGKLARRMVALRLYHLPGVKQHVLDSRTPQLRRTALVASAAPTPAQQREIDRLGAVVITAAPGSDLDRWLRRGRERAAVVRPDGTVQCAGRDITALIDGLTPLTPSAPPPPDRAAPVPASRHALS